MSLEPTWLRSVNTITPEVQEEGPGLGCDCPNLHLLKWGGSGVQGAFPRVSRGEGEWPNLFFFKNNCSLEQADTRPASWAAGEQGGAKGHPNAGAPTPGGPASGETAGATGAEKTAAKDLRGGSRRQRTQEAEGPTKNGRGQVRGPAQPRRGGPNAKRRASLQLTGGDHCRSSAMQV